MLTFFVKNVIMSKFYEHIISQKLYTNNGEKKKNCTKFELK